MTMRIKLSLSPTLFLVLEAIILLPNILFVVGLILWILMHSQNLYLMVISKNFFQDFGVTIISPTAGGFLAYQYLERYHPQGFIKFKAKGILAYSIVVIGVVSAYFLLKNV